MLIIIYKLGPLPPAPLPVYSPQQLFCHPPQPYATTTHEPYPLSSPPSLPDSYPSRLTHPHHSPCQTSDYPENKFPSSCPPLASLILQSSRSSITSHPPCPWPPPPHLTKKTKPKKTPTRLSPTTVSHAASAAARRPRRAQWWGTKNRRKSPL